MLQAVGGIKPSGRGKFKGRSFDSTCLVVACGALAWNPAFRIEPCTLLPSPLHPFPWKGGRAKCTFTVLHADSSSTSHRCSFFLFFFTVL